jgi:DNA-damage-inducible protein D
MTKRALRSEWPGRNPQSELLTEGSRRAGSAVGCCEKHRGVAARILIAGRHTQTLALHSAPGYDRSVGKPEKALPLFDESGDSFEALSKQNGKRYWLARDLMMQLGYESWTSFKNVINKAIGVCTATGIPVAENFGQCSRKSNGRTVEDFELTRLACCLVAMNGDAKNPLIAKAQLYFVALDKIFQDALTIHAEGMDRIITRSEISDREVSLSKTAERAGVEFHDRFRNAGYRGMYNMDLQSLKRVKGLPDMSRPLFDFMGKEELAGNLFRLTLTEGRIKKENTTGQAALEHVAHDVGRKVRETMIQETGIAP